MIERFGADTGRVFELFAAPPEKDLEWTDAGAEGCQRFLGRVYRFVTRNVDRAGASSSEPRSDADRKVLRKLHQTVRKVTDDFETRWHFNTSIAAVMELVNELYTSESDLTRAVKAEVSEKLVLLLGPFAPYMAEELWAELGRQGPVFRQPWPEFSEDVAREEGAEIVLQANGKVRSRAIVPFGTKREQLEKLALTDDKMQPFLQGRQIVKIIVVPDKLVNVVVKG
jgi:leucyl-tRNA synthetase